MQNGGVAQLVRASACHAEGRGFEPHRLRFALYFLLSKNRGFCATLINKKGAPASGWEPHRLRCGIFLSEYYNYDIIKKAPERGFFDTRIYIAS